MLIPEAEGWGPVRPLQCALSSAEPLAQPSACRDRDQWRQYARIAVCRADFRRPGFQGLLQRCGIPILAQ